MENNYIIFWITLGSLFIFLFTLYIGILDEVKFIINYSNLIDKENKDIERRLNR